MWPKLRSSLAAESRSIPREGDTSPDQLQWTKRVSSSMRSSINVNEEYRKALRTKSYVDVWTKIHLQRSATHLSTTTPKQPPSQLHTPSSSTQEEDDSTACTSPLTLTPTLSPLSTSSSPFHSYSHLPDDLLEPYNQEALLGTVRDPDLHALFVDYFDASMEACNICGSLLGSIDQLRRNHRSIQRLLNHTITTATATATATATDSANLSSYIELQNPLSSLKTVDFHRIHGLYESLIRRLMLARDSIMRRVRLVRLVKRASKVTLVAACGALATAVLVVAAHAVVVLVVAGGPALAGPFSAWVRRRRGPVRAGRLARLGAQVDAAARGAYIMSRDMETMSRMVTRLHDEVEHGKDVVRLFLRSRERWVLREVAEAAAGGGFVELLEELEEHVYWCLLTINRIRGLVAQEIIAGPSRSPTTTTTTTTSSE